MYSKVPCHQSSTLHPIRCFVHDLMARAMSASSLRYMTQIYFGKSTRRYSMQRRTIQPASGRRSLPRSCSGPTPHTLQHSVQQSYGLSICTLETSPSMPDASQLQAQQNMLPTSHHSPTCFKITSSLFIKNGIPNIRISSHTVVENSCMVYGLSYLMKTSSMLTSIGLWCKARTR
jgi:hypothetical protein